jgi:hypothetical protein
MGFDFDVRVKVEYNQPIVLTGDEKGDEYEGPKTDLLRMLMAYRKMPVAPSSYLADRERGGQGGRGGRSSKRKARASKKRKAVAPPDDNEEEEDDEEEEDEEEGFIIMDPTEFEGKGREGMSWVTIGLYTGGGIVLCPRRDTVTRDGHSQSFPAGPP